MTITDTIPAHLAEADPAISPSDPLIIPSVVLCDIDGTVAINDGHRGHFDWDKVLGDKQNEAVCELVADIIGWGTEVIFMSGRMEQSRYDTLSWLAPAVGKHQWPKHAEVPQPHKLFMRADEDFRPDNIVKRELYERHIVGRFRVRFVLDDRDQVVAMWREELGLTCLQVAPGAF